VSELLQNPDDNSLSITNLRLALDMYGRDIVPGEVEFAVKPLDELTSWRMLRHYGYTVDLPKEKVAVSIATVEQLPDEYAKSSPDRLEEFYESCLRGIYCNLAWRTLHRGMLIGRISMLQATRGGESSRFMFSDRRVLSFGASSMPEVVGRILTPNEVKEYGKVTPPDLRLISAGISTPRLVAGLF